MLAIWKLVGNANNCADEVSVGVLEIEHVGNVLRIVGMRRSVLEHRDLANSRN